MDVEIEEFQPVLSHNTHKDSNYYHKHHRTNNESHCMMMNTDRRNHVVEF